MSAYMVDSHHIHYLLTAAMSRHLNKRPQDGLEWLRCSGECDMLHQGDHAKATKVGQMLWDENRKSIECRYPDDPDMPDNDWTYEFRPWQGEIDPVQVIKACHCYSYQASEHPGWKESEAHAFIEALEDRAACALPGYDEAAWGAPEPI
jgi:hypothetical protein